MAVHITSADDAQCGEGGREGERERVGAEWLKFDCVFQIYVTMYTCNGNTLNYEVAFMEWEKCSVSTFVTTKNKGCEH
jgi:hypothetical protein